MDFQTLVNRFQKNVLNEEEQQVDELTQKSRKIVRKYMADGTPGRHQPLYSFSDLFEDPDDMRVAIELEDNVAEFATDMFKRIVDDLGWQPDFSTKMVQQKRRRQAADGGGEYTVEVPMVDLNMKKTETKTIPRGPRAGETVQTEKNSSLGKIIQKSGTPEEKEWWAKNQNSLREKKNVEDWFVKPWNNDFEKLSPKPVIIISRHPIDVARMSDHGMTRSCHSEGAGYFQCALHESKGHGMVAYLVSREEWERYELADNLQNEEIFQDSDVGLSGATPIGRVRLRKLYNPETDEEFATVEDRVYGIDHPDFLPTVRKWARDKQKDIWLDEDGNIDQDALSDSEWILVGGSYLDTDVSNQLIEMFDETEWERDAMDYFRGQSYNHEDYFDEEDDGVYEAAENRIEELRREYDELEHIGIYLDIEEGWDDMAYIANGGFQAVFTFTVPEGWDENPDHIIMPDYRSSFQAQREVQNEIEEVVDSITYTPDNFEVYTEQDESIKITMSANYQVGGNDPAGIDELENQLDSYKRDFDDNYKEIENALALYLTKEGYLPPLALQGMVKELESLELDNVIIDVDEDNLSDGVRIVSKDPETGREGMIPFGVYPYVDPKTKKFAWPRWTQFMLDKSYIAAKVRSAFNRASRKAERETEKQLGLPGIPQTQKERVKLPYELEFQFYSKDSVPDRARRLSAGSRYTAEDLPELLKNEMFEWVYHFNLTLPFTSSEEKLRWLMNFATFLDENIDSITKAAAKVANELYEDAVDMTEDEPLSEKQELSPTATDQTRARLREMVKKAIKRKLMEQEGFETRLFQVNLRLLVDKGQGGGIEQKLNRIRAIEGVTVVSHIEGDSVIGKDTIEAKIKFHPPKGSERGISYVRRVLIPDINNSQQVPGVKVLEAVPKSLKRLDK